MPSKQEEEAEKDDNLQYGQGPTREELDAEYPNRPHNRAKTLPFHELFKSLFNPLDDARKQRTGPTKARSKQGPHGPASVSPHEQRKIVIQRFISRWRTEVGDDFYPALRLILPHQDRDRPIYGLKEKAIGKLLVKLLKINPSSEDGSNLLNWKLPGQITSSATAGDFARRCYAVLSKRVMRSTVGDMRIAEVNAQLDKLAAAQKEEQQLPIFETFYERMNAEELMWLIRIILRQMKVGATEKTFLNLWHEDGEALFNVSSSLRRVCWELADSARLPQDKAEITVMSCFQPQLAQFQGRSFQQMVDQLGVTLEEPEFWIEEKLDGERMQLHMDEDENGQKRFAFWSRKGKDYTYLYGHSFDDEKSALTRHIREAFDPGVRNIILDGEMITWDPDSGTMVPFGTLKTAALMEQKDGYGKGMRPLLRVFDCLFVNDQDITRYELRERHKALDRFITDVHERLEKLHVDKAKSVDEIEGYLRKVVARGSEGLVLKNPRSMYQLNSRNNDWMKVKPEYMTEFGENLDCLIIGGYYGSGHRGGRLSSFLCGLRVDSHIQQSQDAGPMKFHSFFKVGGGFRADDYANIKHHTDGKWIDWDLKNPPNEYIKLGGSNGQAERPDVWIKPSDSVVVEVKAASVGVSDQFGTRYTLRFPRFKKLRMDKDWKNALSISEFANVKEQAEQESKEKKMEIDNSRKRIIKRLKKELVIAGNDSKVKTPYAGPKMEAFEGLNFCVLSEMLKPEKKSKAEIEQIIKSNGGAIFQSPTAKEDIVCIGDKKVVKVASLIKAEKTSLVKPSWLLDALKQVEIDGPGKQKFLVPFEPNHMFYMAPDDQERIESNADIYGDSYARDISPEELKSFLDDMIQLKNSAFSPNAFLSELEEHGKGLGEMGGFLFKGCTAWIVPVGEGVQNLQEELDRGITVNRFKFAGGIIADASEDVEVTHFVVVDRCPTNMRYLREVAASGRRRLPRIVKWTWLEDSWSEKTLLDEERYAVVA